MTVSKTVILKYIFIDFKSIVRNLSDNFPFLTPEKLSLYFI